MRIDQTTCTVAPPLTTITRDPPAQPRDCSPPGSRGRVPRVGPDRGALPAPPRPASLTLSATSHKRSAGAATISRSALPKSAGLCPDILVRRTCMSSAGRTSRSSASPSAPPQSSQSERAQRGLARTCSHLLACTQRHRLSLVRWDVVRVTHRFWAAAAHRCCNGLVISMQGGDVEPTDRRGFGRIRSAQRPLGERRP